jgi:hypothetical protein
VHWLVVVLSYDDLVLFVLFSSSLLSLSCHVFQCQPQPPHTQVLSLNPNLNPNFLHEANTLRKTGKLDDNLEPEDLDPDYSSDDAVTVDADMLFSPSVLEIPSHSFKFFPQLITFFACMSDNFK